MKDQDRAPYRWVILGIAWLSFFAVAMSWYIMPTLEHQLLDLYNISPAQYSAALTAPFLVAGLLSIGGGMLADRLGIRVAGAIGVVVAGIGIFGRSYVEPDFAYLMGPMMVVGVGLGFVMPNLPKLVSVWFPPDETGLATGIYNTGLMGGIATGLVIAPFLPDWSTANMVLGAAIILLGLVFFAVVRDAPLGKELPLASLVEGLGAAVRSKSVWATTLAVAVALAGMVSLQAALPAGLNAEYGLPMSTAGQIASLISYFGILGALTLPALADRLNLRRLFLVALPISFSVIMYLSWLSGENTTVLWLGTAVAGYLAGGSLPLLMEVPAFLPRIEGDPVRWEHVGGAAGLIGSMLNIGGFAGFPFIVMPVIISSGYSAGLLLAAALFASQALFVLGIELPRKATVSAAQ